MCDSIFVCACGYVYGDTGIYENSVPIDFRNANRALRFEGSDSAQFCSLSISTEDSEG